MRLVEAQGEKVIVMPSPRQRIAIKVNPGDLRNNRNEKVRSKVHPRLVVPGSFRHQRRHFVPGEIQLRREYAGDGTTQRRQK